MTEDIDEGRIIDKHVTRLTVSAELAHCSQTSLTCSVNVALCPQAVGICSSH